MDMTSGTYFLIFLCGVLILITGIFFGFLIATTLREDDKKDDEENY